mmetsp:Transcript_1088/g.3496  ORF Transcript_1088/g.3496 Transcript_1088/m.3496 type:complete len:215 (-) Transcript_1088:754-1398(-)
MLMAGASSGVKLAGSSLATAQGPGCPLTRTTLAPGPGARSNTAGSTAAATGTAAPPRAPRPCSAPRRRQVRSSSAALAPAAAPRAPSALGQPPPQGRRRRADPPGPPGHAARCRRGGPPPAGRRPAALAALRQQGVRAALRGPPARQPTEQTAPRWRWGPRGRDGSPEHPCGTCAAGSVGRGWRPLPRRRSAGSCDRRHGRCNRCLWGNGGNHG